MRESQITQETGWVSVKEFALMKGVSERAIRKNIASGKYQVKEVPHPSRTDQVSYMIMVESAELRNCGTSESAEPDCGTAELRNCGTSESAEPDCGTTEKAEKAEGQGDIKEFLIAEPQNRLKPVERPAEASGTMQASGTSDPLGERTSHQAFNLGITGSNPVRVTRLSEEVRERGSEELTGDEVTGAHEADGDVCQSHAQGCNLRTEADGDVCHSINSEEYVPYHKMDEAQLYALCLEEIDRRIRSAGSKTEEWKQIAQDYNEGRLVPELKKLKGRRSERALRFWWQKWQSSDQDMFELIHKNNAQVRGRKVTQVEQDFLLSALLEDSKISIGSAITNLKDHARMYGIESPSSTATLKRWANDWAAQYPAVWAQARQGDKYVKDNIIKSLMRDTSDIKFGDVLVADGHIISNDIINPVTGKAARLTLIMFYDWASRYPVGASLAYTEDSSHILTALRNAILQLEFIPKFVYLDNGRAFKSKLFHAWEEHDLSKELAGIMPRLGIMAHFAEAYNGRSKVIERFFKTMQDQWERFMKSFRGASIADKPSRLMRNEKWAQKMFADKPLEYDEALNMAYFWVRYMYGEREHSALKGRTPYQVFSESERPADRAIKIRELDILMLKAERAKVRKDGIMLMGNRYWSEELVDHALQPVIIRYDYCDLRSILVYDLRSELICQAEMRESVHGFAFLSDNPLAYQEVKAEIKEVKRIHRTIQKVTKQQVLRAKAGVAREIAKHQGAVDAVMGEIEERNPLFKNKPMMPEVKRKKVDVNVDVAELERIAVNTEAQRSRGTEGSEKVERWNGGSVTGAHEADGDVCQSQGKVIVLEDLLKDDEGELAETVSFSEMQKIIGIKR